MRSQGSKKKFLAKAAVLLILLGGVTWLFVSRKDALVKEGTRLLEAALTRSTDYQFKIGKVSSDFFGFISFKAVEVAAPWLPEEQRILFKAEEIRFHYRFVDFLSKRFDSKIEVIAKRPEVYWRSEISLRGPRFPFMEWMKQWALSQQKNLVIRLEKLDFIFGHDRRKISGINATFEGNDLEAEIPVSHMSVAGSDMSSVIKIDGRFEIGVGKGGNALTGRIRTEGTVINWKPLPQELTFNFSFSEDRFELTSSDFLGGIEVKGAVDFAKDYNIDFFINASNYPLSHLAPFLKMEPGMLPPGRFDLDTHFYGNPWQPNVESRTRIYNGWIGSKTFKAMDVNVVGVYPTVQLTDSKILMPDESTMRFADKTIEAGELFKEKTYEALVAEAQQETVVWGDWEFSRSKDANESSGLLMERSLGDNTKVHFTKFYEGFADQERTNEKQMEVGFEYRLRSKDSLKLELRDDEEFVGVERKMKF